MQLLVTATVFLAAIGQSNGFFAKLFDYGPRGSNCLAWSLWSPCYSTAQLTMFMRMPANCMSYNPVIVPFVQNGGIRSMDLAYKYLRKVNQSSTPCGMCSFQVSCSRNCNTQDMATQQLAIFQGFAAQPGVINPYGISQRLCEGLEQSTACIADPAEAYDPAIGMCQMWPPLRDQALPDSVGITKQVVQYNVPPTPCILANGRCYCCCAPYVPDANTLKCVRYLQGP